LRVKRGSHTGQTQSQYLSFGESEDGKAEAEATKVASKFLFMFFNERLLIL
jgi:hypothetical protein